MAWADGLHPDLVVKMSQVLTAMGALGLAMRVTDGLRTAARQAELYRQGRTTPGARVTNADGLTHRSNHQQKADGYGHACDAAFLGADPYLEHDALARERWSAYGACGKAVGLAWGGDWTSMPDKPHLELPDGVQVTGAPI